MSYKEVRRNPTEVIHPDYREQFGIDDTGIGWIFFVGDDLDDFYTPSDILACVTNTFAGLIELDPALFMKSVRFFINEA